MEKWPWTISVAIMLILFSVSILPAQNTADGDGTIKPGENPETELAKAAQNPVADLISLPFQNNTNFGFGPGDDIQNVLNIQPVVPFHLNENWNLITRTIAPLIYQPEVVEGTGDEFGLGVDYDDDWAGRYYTTETELLTFGINPSMAYRINDLLSVAADSTSFTPN